MNITDSLTWVLGWAQTDGSFDKDRPRVQFRVEPKDIDVLEKIKYILDDTDNKISIKPNNGGLTQIAEFKLTNRFLHGFKYLKTEAPPELTPTQTRSFIRGLFEGDGSLYWDPKCKHSVVEFTNNNPHVVEYVSKTFSYLLDFPPKEIKVDNKLRFKDKFKSELKPSYRIYWTGRRANLIAWYLWHGEIENTSLDRKRNLYLTQVLGNNIEKEELLNLLTALKCDLYDDKIHINVRADLTLEWAKRIKHLLCANATPIILKSTSNKGKRIDYFGLHVPKLMKIETNSFIYKSIWT